MARLPGPDESELVLRPLVAIALWSYAAWYAGALLAVTLGLSEVLGPIAAVAMAAFVTYDWRRPRASRRVKATSPRVEEQPQGSR
jgi:hypothetical protein